MSEPLLDLRLLHCFEAVAAKGSLTAAAKELHVTQPAATMQLKRLEAQLGGALFERQRRGMVMTRLGKLLVEYVGRYRNLATAIARVASDFAERPRGRVTVGTYTTATSYLLRKCLSSFFRSHPDVSLFFDYSAEHLLMSRLRSYDLDCGIMAELPDASDLDRQPIVRVPMVYVVGKRFGALPDTIPADELQNVPFLSYSNPEERVYQQSVVRHVGVFLERARVVVEGENQETFKRLAIDSVGATILPQYMVERELKTGQLRHVKIAHHKLHIDFSFATKRDALLSAATVALRRQVLAAFAGYR